MFKADAQKIIDIYNAGDGDKGTLRSHLSEIADYMVPAAQSVFTQATPGGKRMSKIYDGTAIRALRTFANGLYGHLTNPASPWFELTCKNKSIAEVANVKYWLADTTERMRSAINTSNAAASFHEIYFQEGWTGTGILFTEPGRKYLLNFQTFNVANCVITEDAQGCVDGIYRLIKYTAPQMVQQWPQTCPEKVTKAVKKDDKTTKFEVIHAVYPRNDYDWRKMDNMNMPWSSAYIERESKVILSEGGFNEFPFSVPRWEKEEGSAYGRGPAMDALPDVKMLNQICYDNLRGMQKVVDPPIFASKESALSTNRTAPGTIIYHKSGEKPEPFLTGGRLDWALEVENQRRQAIKEAFYTDLFMLLAQDQDKTKTAYEVSKLVEEKLTLLGPALGRQQTEFFDPMLNRVFWILFRSGHIQPPPQELYNQGLEINYIGRLALAMKSVETQAAVNTITIAKDIYEIRPDIFDNFNVDEFIQGTALRNGTPIKYMNPPDTRDKIRADRAQQQQQQADTETALAIAGQIPNLSKAPEPGSLMEQL